MKNIEASITAQRTETNLYRKFGTNQAINLPYNTIQVQKHV